MASRMAARSTTAGTPVKSCISTRAQRKLISLVDLPPFFTQSAKAAMSAFLTVVPSSWRTRFSIRMRSEKGRRERSPTSFSTALRLK